MTSISKTSRNLEVSTFENSFFSENSFNWIVATFSFWFVSGLHIDGWAHNNLSESLETFFTPWHAILYSGFGATAAIIVYQWIVNRKGHKSWKNAIPYGYYYAFIGIFLFLVGGLGDMLWHIILGIEANIEALYSPTHLLLGVGGTMIISGPLRKAWLTPIEWAKKSFSEKLPAILSAAFTISVITFFFQFALPTHSLLAGGASIAVTTFGSQGIGVSGSLLFTLTLVGFPLLLIRRLTLPFGVFSIIYFLNGIYTTMMRFPLANLSTEHVGVPGETLTRMLFPLIALLTGVVMDMLNGKIQEDNTIKNARIFGILIPLMYFTLFFLVVIPIMGSPWRIQLWSGIITVSTIMGYIVSVFIFPHQK